MVCNRPYRPSEFRLVTLGSMRSSRLEVYVAGHCLATDEARRLAEEASARYPEVEVRVIEIDETPPPAVVVAVPTYLMDGRVIALGNPDPEELFAHLHGAVE
jgi:hypothetical protein